MLSYESVFTLLSTIFTTNIVMNSPIFAFLSTTDTFSSPAVTKERSTGYSGGLERSRKMLFASDLHIFDLGSVRTDEGCVCALSILRERVDSYRRARLGACLDNLMSSYFHGWQSRLIRLDQWRLLLYLLLLWIHCQRHSSRTQPENRTTGLPQQGGKKRLQISFRGRSTKKRIWIHLNYGRISLSDWCNANSSIL